MKTRIIFLFAFVLFALFYACEKNEEVSMCTVNSCFTFTLEGDIPAEKYIAFSNCSENAASYIWNFGDSTASPEENPIHNYSQNGVYVVSLVAINDDCEDMHTDTVVVDWIPTDVSAACFTFSYEEDENQVTYVAFSNCSEDAISYMWDFGDSITSTEEDPIHYYARKGVYVVSLTAINGTYQNVFTDTVKVNWDPAGMPEACFTFTYEGEQIWESYLAFKNCSQNATSYLWDFGDSSTSTKVNPIHYYAYDGVYTVSLTASNGSGSDVFKDTVIVNWTMVDKPNIYLYPEEEIDLCVNVEFPQGGQFIKSIPVYSDGWCVHVDAKGEIDNTYDFLFYESAQPDVWQYSEGWCIKRESLKNFFESNMTASKFNEKEIKDFTDHWIPKLVDSDYYLIYPQYNEEIDRVIQLDFSVQPDNVFRLFYGIKGTDEYMGIPEPDAVKINRDGFTVVEWGVFRK